MPRRRFRSPHGEGAAQLVEAGDPPGPKREPDPIETLEATRELAAEGLWFCLLSADPFCKLEEAGAAAVMPLDLDREQHGVGKQGVSQDHYRAGKRPRGCDAGIGSPSGGRGDGVGADAVLVNTALAVSRSRSMGEALA